MAKSAHRYKLISEQKATCSSEGLKKYKCTICNNIKNMKTAKGSHEYSTKIEYRKISTNSKKHYEVVRCKICGAESKRLVSHQFNSSTNKCICGFVLNTNYSIQINKSKSKGYEKETITLSIGVVGNMGNKKISAVKWEANNGAKIENKNSKNAKL